jgi:hypothetical protein
LSEYRRRDPYRNLKHYRNNASNHYRRRKPYPIHYRNPIKIKVYYKPPATRRARGRLSYPKPRPENVKPPEKKYESKQRSERVSAPPIPKPLRYTSGNQVVEPWVDAEEIAKEVENKLDKKITERILEKFESELEDLINKFAGRLSERSTEITEEHEEKSETSEQDLTESSEERIEGNTQEEVEKPETNHELEHIGETGKDYPSLEGGFNISSTFGLAVPLEDQEINDGTELLENIESESRHLGESEIIEIEGDGEIKPHVEDQRVEAGDIEGVKLENSL